MSSMNSSTWSSVTTEGGVSGTQELYVSTAIMPTSEQLCAYKYDTVFVLDGINITEDIAAQWPCEVREYWNDLLPLILVVQHLLHYGTVMIIACGLVFNIISLIILTSPKMKKQTTNMYLAALATYDALVLVFNFMIGVLRGQNQEVINASFQEHEWLCKAHSVVVEVFNLLSVWMIVCFTMERCVAVYLPLKASQLITPKKTKITIATVSLVLLIFSLHKIFVSGFEGDSVFGYKACITNRKKYPEAIFFYVSFNTALPTLMIIVANASIIFKLHRNSALKRTRSVGKRLACERTSSASRRASNEAKVTKTLLAVSSAYLVLILPLGITQMIELYWNNVNKVSPENPDYIEFVNTKHLLKWIRSLFFFFYQLNFAINFFLYILSTAKFRHIFLSMISCKKGMFNAGSSYYNASNSSQQSGSQLPPLQNRMSQPGSSNLAYNTADD